MDGLTSGNAGQTSGSSDSKGATPAQLRADIYTGIDQITVWIANGKAENGIDYRSTLVSEHGCVASSVAIRAYEKLPWNKTERTFFPQTIIEKHFPGTQVNRCSDEVAVLVGGLINMIFEFSKADSIPAAMALRTLSEKLGTALNAIGDKAHRQVVGDGVVRGMQTVMDPAIATREFAARVQMVGSLKNGE